jgi:disulfide bond formation protein DsbB
MTNPTSILGETANPRKRRVCVLALVLVILAAGVGGVPSSEVRAQGLPPMDATDTSTAEVEVAPTETIAPTATTVSPDPSAGGQNKDMATVTIRARLKAH